MSRLQGEPAIPVDPEIERTLLGIRRERRRNQQAVRPTPQLDYESAVDTDTDSEQETPRMDNPGNAQDQNKNQQIELNPKQVEQQKFRNQPEQQRPFQMPHNPQNPPHQPHYQPPYPQPPHIPYQYPPQNENNPLQFQQQGIPEQLHHIHNLNQRPIRDYIKPVVQPYLRNQGMPRINA